MKSIYRKIPAYIFSAVVIFTLVIQQGCTDGFEDINKNPHEFTKVEPENLMATAVKRTMNSLATMNAKMFWPYSHQVAMQSGSTARYGSSASDVNNIWKNFYTTIFLLKNIQDTYANDEAYHNRVLIAQIWECYLYYVGATTFGSMPYVDACRSDITIIPYDPEQYIYGDILRRLSESFERLDPGKDKFNNDPVFDDGDIVNWKKLANTLRLKIALEVQNAVPEDATRYGKEAVANEEYFISSNDENVILKWNGTTLDESSDYYKDYVYTTPENSSKPAYSHMMFVYQRSYKDPRMEKYADQPEATFTVRDTVYWDETFTTRAVVRYPIPYNGRPVSPANNYAGLDESSSQISQTNPLRMLSSTQYSIVNSSFLKQDGEIILIWYADMCFMQAEAKLTGWGGASTAEEYYNKGIDASFAQYGLSGTRAEAYRSQAGVKWGVGRTDAFPDYLRIVSSTISSDPLHQIIAQRWIAGYFHGGHDAWCYTRRTRLLDFPPHLSPGSLIAGGQGKIANLPERMQYAPDEIKYNNTAYLGAVSKLGGGGDILPTYLKIATPYDRKSVDEWLETKINFNNEAFKNWYAREGNDYTTVVDDLDANEIEWLFEEIVE